jgi:2-oxo-hept-3-ene-1,7-dioate hydratase
VTPEDHARAASDLLKAEKTGIQIGLLSARHPEISMSDAYAIQKAIYHQKLAEGRTVIGWKIGLTSKAMQTALNIDIPDSGILFDDMTFPSGSTVPAGRFIQPRIETEIAFVMKSALDGSATRKKVLEATDYVAPAIEILDTRIRRIDPDTGNARNVQDTISDNAANAGIVLGDQHHHVEDFDLRWVGALTFRNGEIEETGLGAGVLNDPVDCVAWLARRMAKYGQKIEPGHIVLSGSFIRPVECPPGAKIHADFGPFGNVDIDFAEGENNAGST